MTVWLIFGSNGQLGRSLQISLEDNKIDFVAYDKQAVDITDKSAVERAINQNHPEVVVNAAAWTKVDDAEDYEELAFSINATGALHIAEVCAAQQVRLVHISTDYVFPGNATSPISEGTAGMPISAYGRTKWVGERLVRRQLRDHSIIVRTAWLYSQFGTNFARTMARRAIANQPVKVVSDQIGQPTFASDLSEHILNLVNNNAPSGTYHGTNSGEASWYQFACAIYKWLDREQDLVTPIPASEYSAKASRPNYSVLGHQNTVRAGLDPMRNWDDALFDSMPLIMSTLDLG